jgi:hypothetical protein
VKNYISRDGIAFFSAATQYAPKTANLIRQHQKIDARLRLRPIKR